MCVLCVLCGLCGENHPAHPLKLCVCDAKYQPASRQLTLKFKFFWDDLETVLEKQTGRDLNLQTPSVENERLLTSFVRANFSLKINGLAIKPRYIRSDIEDVVLAVTFAGDGFEPAAPYHVEVTNQILLDAFPDQYDVVRFDFFGDGNLETLRFEKAERHLTKTIAKK